MSDHVSSRYEVAPRTSKYRPEYRLMRDSRSCSENHNQKPEWWFFLSRTGQRAGMRKIDLLYKVAPGLTWEEKWAVTEAAMREDRPVQMAGIDEAVLHLRRFIVFEGDRPLPDPFTNCLNEQERLEALLARPSPAGRMGLDTFSRRTASGRSMDSSSNTQKNVISIQNKSEDSGEDNVKSFGGTRELHIEDEESDEEDQVMQRLIESCNVGNGSF